MPFTKPEELLLLSAYAALSAYFLLCLYAVWLRPSLLRFKLLRPWWRGGSSASRAGVTTQAAFVFALSLFGTAKMYDLWWQSLAGAAFVIAMAAMAFMWWADEEDRASTR